MAVNMLEIESKVMQSLDNVWDFPKHRPSNAWMLGMAISWLAGWDNVGVSGGSHSPTW